MGKESKKMMNLIAVRLDESRLEELKAYRKQQDDPPTNAEAIRQLFDMGLKAWKAQKRGKQ